MMKRFLAALLLLIALLFGGIFSTERGSRLLLLLLPCRFEGIRGAVLTRLDLEALECSAGGIDLAADRLRLSWRWPNQEVTLARFRYRDGVRELLGRELRLAWRPVRLLHRHLAIDGVEGSGLRLHWRQGGGTASPKPPPLTWPLRLDLRRMRLSDLQLVLDDRTVPIRSVQLAATAFGNHLQLKRLEITFPEMELKGSRIARSAIRLKGKIVSEGEYPLQLTLSWRAHLGEVLWAGQGRLSGTLAQLRLTQKLLRPFPFEISGRLTPSSQPIRLVLEGRWKGLRWPLQRPTLGSREGHFRLEGDPGHYRFSLASDLRFGEIPARLSLKGEGSSDRIFLSEIRAELLRGTVEAHGLLSWKRQLEGRLSLRGEGLSSTEIFPRWPGRFTFTAELHGFERHRQLVVEISRLKLSGQLRGVALRAEGRLRFQKGHGRSEIALPTFVLQRDGGRVVGRGTVQLEPELQWNLQAAGGGLPLGDHLSLLGLELESSGTGREASFHLSHLRLRWQRPGPLGERHLSGQRRGIEIGMTGTAKMSRSAVDHGARLLPSWFRGRWRIERLSLEAPGTTLNLSGHLSRESVGLKLELKASRLIDLHPELGGSVWLTAQVGGSPEAPELTLKLKGRGLRWRSLAAEKLSAALDTRRPGRLELLVDRLQAGKNSYRRLLFRLAGRASRHTVRLQVERATDRLLWQGWGKWQERRWTLQAEALTLVRGRDRLILGQDSVNRYHHTFQIDLSQTPFRIDQKLRLRLSQLKPLSPWIPEIREPRGRIALNLHQSGRLGSLRHQIAFQGEALAFRLPRAGIALRGGRISVKTERPNRLQMAGQIESGGGLLRFKGFWHIGHAFRLKIEGHRFLALDLPQIRARLSPDLLLFHKGGLGQGTDRPFHLEGIVRVDWAKIQLPEPPWLSPVGVLRETKRALFSEGVGASGEVVYLSEDEVIVGQKEPPRRRLPLSLEVELQLSDEVSLKGYGLRADLRGRLQLRQQEGRIAAYGTLSLTEGVLKAYGQRLNLRKGLLSFNGPLDHPTISAVAFREIPSAQITVQIRVEGRLPHPEVVIESQPPLPEQEALSYLLLGKPSSELARGRRALLTQVGIQLGAGYLESWLDRGGTAGEGSIWHRFARWLHDRLLLDLTFDYRLGAEGGVLLLHYRILNWLALEAETGAKEAVDLLLTLETDGIDWAKLFGANARSSPGRRTPGVRDQAVGNPTPLPQSNIQRGGMGGLRRLEDPQREPFPQGVMN